MVKIGLSDKYWKHYVNVGNDPAYVEEENKRLAKQASCEHHITTTFRKYDKFSTKCEVCLLIIASDAMSEVKTTMHSQDI